MKIAIVDDEKFWRDRASKMVQEHFRGHELEIDEYESGVKFLKDVKYYDIVIMDIEMPGLNGFQTIAEYRKDFVKTVVMILTTHMEISNIGYLVNAFRYINKENIVEELTEALQSVTRIMEVYDTVSLNVVGLGGILVMIRDILFVETKKRNIVVYTENNEFECSNSLTSIENQLELSGFYRSHKSYLVNLDRIKKFDKQNIYFSGNRIAFLSAHKYAELKERYMARLIHVASM